MSKNDVTQTTMATVISIDPFLKPKRTIHIDMHEYHDDSFAVQIHDHDTADSRKLMAQRLKVFADKLEGRS